MIECETGLAAFTGTDGHAGAQKAADILEQFLAKVQRHGRRGAGLP